MGFIKTYRQVMYHPRYTDPIWFKVWMHLLLSAWHSPRLDRFDGKEITLQPGQLVTGRKRIAQDAGVSESQVRRVLINLENDHQINQVTCAVSTLITITNWTKYQATNQDNNQAPTKYQPSSNQAPTTSQECENSKKVENTLSPSSKTTRVRKGFVSHPLTPLSDYALERGKRWNTIVLSQFPNQGTTEEQQQRGLQDLMDAGYTEDAISMVLNYVRTNPKFPKVEHLRSTAKLMRKPESGSPYGSKGANYANWMEVFADEAGKVSQ